MGENLVHPLTLYFCLLLAIATTTMARSTTLARMASIGAVRRAAASACTTCTSVAAMRAVTTSTVSPGSPCVVSQIDNSIYLTIFDNYREAVEFFKGCLNRDFSEFCLIFDYLLVEFQKNYTFVFTRKFVFLQNKL